MYTITKPIAVLSLGGLLTLASLKIQVTASTVLSMFVISYFLITLSQNKKKLVTKYSRIESGQSRNVFTSNTNYRDIAPYGVMLMVAIGCALFIMGFDAANGGSLTRKELFISELFGLNGLVFTVYSFGTLLQLTAIEVTVYLYLTKK